MAILRSRTLFFTTSPRSPQKMKPEIQLLCEQFSGLEWQKKVQEAYIEQLAGCDFFEGKGSPKDKAFSARDRINRAPKALGFVDLSPKIQLTDAGREFVYGKRSEEIFLRQLLKFQLPSPYHKELKTDQGMFFVRPYLEIMRLIRSLGRLTFDEFKIFALQLTDYHKFDQILDKIKQFREDKEKNKGRYKSFVDAIWEREIRQIYQERIQMGKTKTRETRDDSLKKFLKTQKGNLRDYTDAGFRYLRYTGLVCVSHKNKSISFFEDKLVEVDFILNNVDRDPVFIDDEDKYKAYLFSSAIPELYGDNKDNLIDTLMRIGSYTKRDLIEKKVCELKDLKADIIRNNRNRVINEQVERIKSYALYSEIIDTFHEIISEDYYDAPLMLEYNTWRAMTMLDGGNIKPNFNFDDSGQPMSTAAGNMPDIECDYGDFSLSVEVTLQRGQRQYESEGEPVARHYGKLKRLSNKETYCIFIAPDINPATLAYFYGLNHLDIALYGGRSKIVPLNIDQFIKLVDNAYNYQGVPCSKDIRFLLDDCIGSCMSSKDETHWKTGIQSCVDRWLSN